MKIEDLIKTIDAHNKRVQSHLAICYISSRLMMNADVIVRNQNLTIEEKRKRLVELLKSVCDHASKIFPRAKDDISEMRSGCLKPIIVSPEVKKAMALFNRHCNN